MNSVQRKAFRKKWRFCRPHHGGVGHGVSPRLGWPSTGLVGSLPSSAGDIHAPNRAQRLQPRNHRAGLDMSQLSMRPEERSQCSTARRSHIQASVPRNVPCMRSRSHAGHAVERSRRGRIGAALQGMAPDLKAEEPNSELDAKETNCGPGEVSSRGGMCSRCPCRVHRMTNTGPYGVGWVRAASVPVMAKGARVEDFLPI